MASNNLLLDMGVFVPLIIAADVSFKAKRRVKGAAREIVGRHIFIGVHTSYSTTSILHVVVVLEVRNMCDVPRREPVDDQIAFSFAVVWWSRMDLSSSHYEDLLATQEYEPMLLILYVCLLFMDEKLDDVNA